MTLFSLAPQSLRKIPQGVWALGFVSLLMDVSSEMIHALLPVYLVAALGASMTEVGVIEGVAEFDGVDRQDFLRRALGLARAAQAPRRRRLWLGGADQARLSAGAEPGHARRRALPRSRRQGDTRRAAGRARRRSRTRRAARGGFRAAAVARYGRGLPRPCGRDPADVAQPRRLQARVLGCGPAGLPRGGASHSRRDGARPIRKSAPAALSAAYRRAQAPFQALLARGGDRRAVFARPLQRGLPHFARPRRGAAHRS